MKGKKKRSIAAVFMAMLMLSGGGILPDGVTLMTAKAASATEGTVTTWDAASILAASTTDNGLTLCGDGWSNNNATDDKSFADGTSAVGDNAKAGSTKAQTSGAKSAGTIPDSGCYVKYEAENDGTLTIYTKIGKGKTFYIVDSDGTAVSKKNDSDSSSFDMVSMDVKTGKSYYAYLGDATAQIWKVTFTKKVEPHSWDAASILAASTTDNGLTLCGDGWSNNNATDDKSFADGTSAVGDNAKAGGTKAQTSGAKSVGTIPDSGCYVKYEAENDGTLTIYTKIGKGKTFYIVDSDGTAVSKKNDSDSSSFDMVSMDVKTGKSYYAYLGDATAQIWKITFTPPVDTVEWKDVKAPVIDSVTVNAEGNFEVTLSQSTVIDSKKGAEAVTVAMLEGGNEVSTKVLTALGTGVVTFTPMWSGDYSFVATATRTGEAYKTSNVVEINGYILALKKPKLELIQNKGNGSVYLDWINIDGGDSFKVEYKKSSDAAYTTAADNLTDGHYTVTGLAAGNNYDFKISAVRSEDNFIATYEQTDFPVTADAEHLWNMAIVGSAQKITGTLTDASGTETAVNMSSEGSTAEADKSNLISVPDITNTSGKLLLNGDGYGKISDTEEGFRYYFTQIDPNTENFELTATFKITDTSLTLDNQTGFGIIATDMLGIDYYGAPGYSNKHFNSVGSYTFSCKGAETFAFTGLRDVSGYTSVNTQDSEGRVVNQQKFSSSVASAIGTEATFTLRKTNDAFEAEYNGEKLTLDNTAALSVQEDGSLCVGVMTSRKISVEISNIRFSTSESTGVSGTVTDDKVTPNATIYSSGTVGADTYKYIYQPNCAGTLKVTDNSGNEVYNSAVAANEVVKIDIPVALGDNTITSVLNPSGSNITSTAAVTKTTKVSHKKYGKEGETIVVSPDGTPAGDGTMENPLDVATALQYAQPGQIVLLKDGTYNQGVSIGRSVCGTAEKNITLVAENVGGVVFDGAGITVVGDYWHIYGINVKNAPGVGIQISGNYNTVEMCVVQGSANSGVQISRSGSADNTAGIQSLLWPSYNLIKNCESFDNCDAGRNDADGFAAKLTCGNGNQFYGCIAHNNIDDGWDLYAKAISGEIGSVTIENCVAYNNGWLTTEDTTAAGYNYGEGNGFKLGGGDLKGGHVLRNSISFSNGAKGITSNSCPDCEIYDSTSYNNSVKPGENAYNIGLNAKTSLAKEWIVDGLISMSVSSLTNAADLIPFSLSSATNYIYDGSASYNTQGVTASDDWFVSTDVTVLPTRNENGTINMHGLLELKDTAPADSGARLDITSDRAISVKPQITTIVSDVEAGDGDTGDGGAADSTDTQDGDTGDGGAADNTDTQDDEDKQDNEDTQDDEDTSDSADVNDNTTDASVDAVNVPVMITGIDGDVSNIVTAKVQSLNSSIMTDEIKNATGCSTAEQLTEYLKAFITVGTENAPEGVLKDVPVQNTNVMDVVIKVSYDGGATWTEATEANFPASGLDVVLPYPAGTNMDNFDFIVGHLYTKNWNGKVPGQTEYIIPEKTAQGIKVHITGASPFVIGWKELETGNLTESVSDASPTTGDSMGSMVWMLALLMAASAAYMSVCAFSGRKNKRKI